MRIYVGNREPSVTTTVTSGGVPVDLTASTVEFKMRLQNALASAPLKVDAAASILGDPEDGRVKYDWTAGDVNTPGEYAAWFTVTTSGREQDTPEFDVDILSHGRTATSADLCTIQDVRVVLQASADDQGLDDEIAALIPVASRVIMRRCEREFAPPTDTLTRRLYHTGGTRLVPAPYDLRSVTGITIGAGTSSPLVLNAVDYDYTTAPLNADGVMPYIDIPLFGGAYYPAYTPTSVNVTGNWGFPTVPVDVVQACALTVASWLDRPTASLADLTEGGVDVTPELGGTYGIPLGAYRLLQPFIRLVAV